jgi:hypothetical protein
MVRRFYLDVVEDGEGLAHLDGSGGKEDGNGSAADCARFIALGDYFRR